jgi:hypothetical protein
MITSKCLERGKGAGQRGQLVAAPPRAGSRAGVRKVCRQCTIQTKGPEGLWAGNLCGFITVLSRGRVGGVRGASDSSVVRHSILHGSTGSCCVAKVYKSKSVKSCEEVLQLSSLESFGPLEVGSVFQNFILNFSTMSHCCCR